MLRACLHEDGGSLFHFDPLPLHIEYTSPLQHDVQLVVFVRLLAVRLGRDEYIHANLEPGRFVHDLVAAARSAEPILDDLDFEGMHRANLLDCGFPAAGLRLAPNAAPLPLPHPALMKRRSYAIWWKQGDGPRFAGKLELGDFYLLFSGNGSKRIVVPLDQIVTVEYTHGQLTIHCRLGDPIEIGNLDGPGALLELADSLRVAA
jgi:hypothetical protein